MLETRKKMTESHSEFAMCAEMPKLVSVCSDLLTFRYVFLSILGDNLTLKNLQLMSVDNPYVFCSILLQLGRSAIIGTFN